LPYYRQSSCINYYNLFFEDVKPVFSGPIIALHSPVRSILIDAVSVVCDACFDAGFFGSKAMRPSPQNYR
jgi:hypothetical protein